jgi:hypothetical protein
MNAKRTKKTSSGRQQGQSLATALVNHRLRAVLLTGCLVGLSALAVHAYGNLIYARRAPVEPRTAATPAPAVRRATPPVRQEQQQTVDSVLVTITPRGFDNTQITTVAHPFYLMVDNRSGLNEVDLRVDRVGGDRLRSVNVPQEQLDWSDLLDFAPGEYVLTEANHPAWSCHITLTAQ